MSRTFRTDCVLTVTSVPIVLRGRATRVLFMNIVDIASGCVAGFLIGRSFDGLVPFSKHYLTGPANLSADNSENMKRIPSPAARRKAKSQSRPAWPR